MKIKTIALPALLVLLVAAFSACSRAGETMIAGQTELGPSLQESPGFGTLALPAWQARLLLGTGENPLWFELGEDGPIHIDSPASASLASFEPWPHARHIVGMLHWEGFLVMAVNRGGFLVLRPGENANEALLYRVANGSFWNSYTSESFFIWNDRPAVLLYRNVFFTEHTAPAPHPQVYILDPSSHVPLGLSVPALEALPMPWEAEIVHRGPDGHWFYRMREKGRDQGETAFFRTLDLAEQGERITIEEWRSSWPEETEDENPAFAALPALSEGFVYTGIAFLGDIIVASWEEQEDAGIAAAGFMLISQRP